MSNCVAQIETDRENNSMVNLSLGTTPFTKRLTAGDLLKAGAVSMPNHGFIEFQRSDNGAFKYTNNNDSRFDLPVKYNDNTKLSLGASIKEAIISKGDVPDAVKEWKGSLFLDLNIRLCDDDKSDYRFSVDDPMIFWDEDKGELSNGLTYYNVRARFRRGTTGEETDPIPFSMTLNGVMPKFHLSSPSSALASTR
ncbi:hypothetical protein P7C73_g1850, partial [Tremellales sp. Uapishka_1]